ncbi:DUF4328 domain-containing protein [Catellatospora tritici]|uniref:DUF4328 domain-containing protein n=1 Tax=Catellatospora tritici TaxID=2851566 RepID=UPI001C2D3BE5|nr:DUF4328 domain-containing protein [Catellatospora tritici]MBV1849596.1 DUF4328 domain-containing protein [Catellatospora tritici]
MPCPHCGADNEPSYLRCRACLSNRDQPITLLGVRTYHLRGLGYAVVAALAVYVAGRLLLAVALPLVGRSLVEQAAAGGATARDALHRLELVGNLVAEWLLALPAVLVIMWLWRARKNVDAFPETQVSDGAGWAIAGWLVPVANLIIPCRLVFQVARETVHRRWVKPVVAVWWTTYLAQSFGLLFFGGDRSAIRGDDFAAMAEYFDAQLLAGPVSWLVTTVSASCLAYLVLKVGPAQEARIARGEAAHAQAAYATLAARAVTSVPADVPAGEQSPAGGTIQV